MLGVINERPVACLARCHQNDSGAFHCTAPYNDGGYPRHHDHDEHDHHDHHDHHDEQHSSGNGCPNGVAGNAASK